MSEYRYYDTLQGGETVYCLWPRGTKTMHMSFWRGERRLRFKPIVAGDRKYQTYFRIPCEYEDISREQPSNAYALAVAVSTMLAVMTNSRLRKDLKVTFAGKVYKGFRFDLE